MRGTKIQENEAVDSACEVLGVTTSDAWDVVKVAYRRLAHEFHPDKQLQKDAGSSEKTARFRQAQEAFELLVNNKERFGVPEAAADTFSNSDQNVPEPEWINFKTGSEQDLTAYIKYERTFYDTLVAYLEININDATKLKWYPVPTHTDRIREVRVVRNKVQVMTHEIYSFSQEVSDFREAFVKWQASENRKEEANRLQPRLHIFDDALDEMSRLHRPCVRLGQLIFDARKAHMQLNDAYRPSTVAEVKGLFSKIEEEIGRLQRGGPQIIIDDLLGGVIFHSDVIANQAVIDTVRSWHIRTDGFIDLIDEPVLRAFYERRITSEKVTDLSLASLRLFLEDYVLEDLVDELDVIAPATIELESNKGFVAYPLKYDYFERDGHRVPVAIVTLPLRVYEHNAPEHGKPSKFPVLPFGIELHVEILFESHIIFSGTPGNDLEKKITKHKRSRNRGRAIQGAGDEFGLGRWRPVESTPLPPWFKGSRPRW